eukprot:TRINITY_DN22204_c0_g1_i1.p1 TRINITY_DN22204_c0_g1~~TRINITY_DN22204_c0_g1_i1.p1  ORF type:complete len:171 (+),score=25.83 TRINITY_DN22204_c0_g1_i1:19-531(+)
MLARVLRSSVRAVPARSLTTLARSIPASFAVAKKMPSTRYFSVAPESDDAFKPQVKAAPVEEDSDLQDQIKEVVTANKVVLFMKGTPDLPQCGYSSRVVQMLNHLGVPYNACNVLQSPALREGIKIYSDWPTIPQLYINGEFVGGCDIITDMFSSGELHELLEIPKPAEN